MKKKNIILRKGNSKFELHFKANAVVIHAHTLSSICLNEPVTFQRKFWDKYYYFLESFIPYWVLKGIASDEELLEFVMNSIVENSEIEKQLRTPADGRNSKGYESA